MPSRRIVLRQSAFSACGPRPSSLLSLALRTARSGDELVIEGEDVTYPFVKVKEMLEAEGFSIVEENFDGIEYTVRAVKK